VWALSKKDLARYMAGDKEIAARVAVKWENVSITHIPSIATDPGLTFEERMIKAGHRVTDIHGKEIKLSDVRYRSQE
jgi:hypothetical protein